MAQKKSKSVLLAVSVFFITLIALLTGLFKHASTVSGSGFPMDNVFYYTIGTVFWLSAAYLLNYLLRRFIWGGTLKSAFSLTFLGVLEDFSVALIYMFSMGMIYVNVYEQPVSLSLVFILSVLFVITAFARPAMLKYFSNPFVSSARPFKPGDWICLVSKNGGNSITGKVVSFNNMALRLSTENETLIIFPNNLLDEYIIENFRALNETPRFYLPIEIGSHINVEQGKRLLYTSVKQAFSKIDSLAVAAEPEIMLKKINRDTLEYGVYFYMEPWQVISPESARDKILCCIQENLFFVISNSKSLCEILGKIAIFSSLKKVELEELGHSVLVHNFSAKDTVIKQSESGDSMYIVLEGFLNVFVKSGSNESAEINGDGTIKVGTLYPGGCFGETALFTGEDRSATVISETNSVVMEIGKEPIRALLKANPALAEKFAVIIAERQSINLMKLDEYKNKKDSFVQKMTAKIKKYFDLGI